MKFLKRLAAAIRIWRRRHYPWKDAWRIAGEWE